MRYICSGAANRVQILYDNFTHLSVHVSLNENRFEVHQLAAQTTGTLVCLARVGGARRSFPTGDKMPGRPISSARFASGWLLLRLSRGEIVQRRGDSREGRAE